MMYPPPNPLPHREGEPDALIRGTDARRISFPAPLPRREGLGVGR